MARIKYRSLGYVDKVDTQGALALETHVYTRRSRYRSAFQQAGEKNDLDWRLLAAIGYQESHWDANAVSPTGVRGIMMLTNDTASFLKVNDRDDPADRKSVV